MKIEIWRADPWDIDKLSEVADRIFRPMLNPGTGMRREFPLLFTQENSSNLFYIPGEKKQPISMVATKSWKVRIFESTIPIIAVGSVLTLPEYRNKGLATGLLKKVIRVFRKTVPVMIISGTLNLYRRLGATDFGPLYEITLKEKEIWKGKVYPGVYADEIHELYSNEDVRYERTLSETMELIDALKAPYYRQSPLKGEVFLAGEKGELEAYAILIPYYSRHSLNLKIIEWAGKRDSVLEIMKYVINYYDADSVTLKAQPFDPIVNIAYDKGFDVKKVNNQGLILVLNPQLLVRQMKLYMVNRMKVEKARAYRKDINSWIVKLNDSAKEFKDLKSVTEFFFTEKGLKIPFPDTEGLNYI